jgi:hypothetical protein
MALMDAKEYDPKPARRRRRLIIAAVVVAVAALVFWWFFRYWPEERVVNKFFEALERKDFDAAYGIYFADPAWKQHAAKYNQYPLPQFMLDWGPSSEYATITSHKIDCSTEPKKRDFQSPSGVIVVAIVNGRYHTPLWVEKKDKTLTPSPIDVQCRPGG